MNKLVRFITLLAIVCVAMAVKGPSKVLAKADDAAPAPKCAQYAALASNDVVAPDFQVVVSSKGIRVQGRSEYVAGETPKAFEWRLDDTNCTYSTKFITTPKDPAPQVLAMNSNSAPSTTLAATGNYVAGIKVLTQDPPNYWLAGTTNKLYWTTYSNGTVSYYNYAKGCQGYTTPPPYNTHWYSSGCYFGVPYYNSGNTMIYSSISGNYYNYDFMDPNQRTDTSHYSMIEAHNNGSWAHTWWENHSGEYSWLLHGAVVPDYP